MISCGGSLFEAAQGHRGRLAKDGQPLGREEEREEGQEAGAVEDRLDMSSCGKARMRVGRKAKSTHAAALYTGLLSSKSGSHAAQLSHAPRRYSCRCLREIHRLFPD